MKEPRIWVTSDWHFCHDREFLYKPRGFDKIYKMNTAIVERHNARVNMEDDIYILGDCMLNDNDTGIQLIKSLKGNLHIIRGNHDSEARLALYNQCWNVVEVCEGKFLNYKNYHFYLSHYPCLCSNYDYDKPLKSKMINLCGHSHVQDPFADMDKGLIFHCEMDTNNCYPWLLDDIIIKIKEKINK